MMARLLTDTKPTIMAFAGAASAGGNIAVWMDMVKGAAAFATVLLGVPTAILVLAYWAIKVRNEWNKTKDSD